MNATREDDAGERVGIRRRRRDGYEATGDPLATRAPNAETGTGMATAE